MKKYILLFLVLTSISSAQFPMLAAWQSDAFKPTDIAGIKGWHVARDLIDSLGKSSGDTLYVWNNRLWPATRAIQLADAKKPVIVDSGGIASVAFDGIDDALISTAALTDTLSQPNTVFLVFQIRNSSAAQIAIDGFTASAAGPRHAVGRSAGGLLTLGAGSTFNGPMVSSDSLYVVTAIFNTSTSYIAANRNGVFGDAGISEWLPITIGTRYGGAVTPSNMKISEIIYYSGVLTESQIASVRTYLANKYGIPL